MSLFAPPTINQGATVGLLTSNRLLIRQVTLVRHSTSGKRYALICDKECLYYNGRKSYFCVFG